VSDLSVVSVIIPCLDEETAIGQVVTAVLAENVSEVVVVDGGSLDRSAAQAEAAGARIVVEPRRGYGRAIQAGIAAVRDDAEILVFLDGDGSDSPEFIPDLVALIAARQAVLVLASPTCRRFAPSGGMRCGVSACGSRPLA
jgi:glycosyltransferase involved in cell wall biosynthesis